MDTPKVIAVVAVVVVAFIAAEAVIVAKHVEPAPIAQRCANKEAIFDQLNDIYKQGGQSIRAIDLATGGAP